MLLISTNCEILKGNLKITSTSAQTVVIQKLLEVREAEGKDIMKNQHLRSPERICIKRMKTEGIPEEEDSSKSNSHAQTILTKQKEQAY